MCSRRWLRLKAAGVLLLVTGLSPMVWSDKAYRWVDESGQIHFSDQAVSGVEERQVVELTGPPRQQPSAETQRLLEDNRRWFQKRSEDRQREEAQRAKARAKLSRVDNTSQQRCDKARKKLADAKAKYDVQRRTWLKAAKKRKLREKLELYRSDMEYKCG
ncbi:DUF4124 domain-containing protein [Pseudomaricurvus sp.]|uniref:DUF4124 domain-containing protein n=1 Tax=Pseudomaricurvus sp. TaxID=2004510 RepID=UPI003F6D2F87